MYKNTKYILQHEDTKLAVFQYNGINIETESIAINNKTMHMLPFLQLSSENIAAKLVKWITNRGIPVTRDNIKYDIGNLTTLEFLMKNLGLSLTDHYWFNRVDDLKTWNEINLYNNDFKSVYTLDLENDIKDIADKTNFIPSASLKGDLKKKWIIDEKGVRRLVKGNYGKSCRQSLCEVLAAEIHKRQNKFEYTPYSLIKIKSNNNSIIGCECPNFTSINTEFIPAIDIINSEKKSSSISYYEHYIQICENKGLTNIRQFLEYQILTDFIITNIDRHLNNFGIIRDSKTFHFIKPAPIFDSGNSMFYKSPYIKTGSGLLDIDITSFKTKEIKMLEYVKNPNLVDLSLLPTSDELRKLFSIDAICKADEIKRLIKAYEYKINLLNELQHGIKIYSYNYKKSKQ